MATGSDAGGNSSGGSLNGFSRVDSVSPVRVWTSFATAPISPARDHADRLGVLALDAQDLADALLLAAARVPDVVVRRDLAGADAEVGQPADERVGRRLEDERSKRAVGVGRDLDLLARAVERP